MIDFPLTGNSRVRDAVLSAFAEDRIPHAILIDGETGTGRHTLARYLAMAAVCSAAHRPCGECRACHLAKADTHPDIRITAPEDGKKNISVAQIRAMRSEAFVKPHSAAHRVFVIDQADTMNEQAQNALLKVLEEPPGTVIFLLIAASRSALLDTVLSRCTVFSLSPPDQAAAFSYLQSVCKDSEETIRSALTASGGNIGEALRILSGADTAAAKDAADAFVRFLLKGDAFEMMKVTAPFEKSRVETDRFFKELKLAVAAEARRAPAGGATAKKMTRFYESLTEAQERLVTNINLGLLFCSLVSRAIALDYE